MWSQGSWALKLPLSTWVGASLPEKCSRVLSSHQLDGRESEQAPVDGEGRGGPACCSPWGHKESDTAGRLSDSVVSGPLLPCSKQSLTSLVSSCLNLPSVLWEGLGGEAFVLQIRNGGDLKRLLYPEGPMGPCSVSIPYTLGALVCLLGRAV